MSDTDEKTSVDIKTEDSTIEEKPKDKNELSVKTYRPISIFRDFDRLFDEFDHYFENFLKPSRFWNFEPFGLKRFDEDKFFRTPLTNISEEEDHFLIKAELPGLDKGDLEITIHDGMLEIKGEEKNESEDKREGYVRKEYSSSTYYRSFKLPKNIDEEKIEAKLENGLLKLSLPKIEEKKPEKKKIEVA